MLNLKGIQEKTSMNYAKLIQRIIPKLESRSFLEISRRGKEKLVVITTPGKKYLEEWMESDTGKRFVVEYKERLSLND